MEHEFRANRTPGEALYLHDDKDGWYGGQVHFVARLIGGDSSRLKLELEKPSLGPSCEFTRRFGSDRFVRVRVDKNTLYASDSGLVEYFVRPFIIGGHVFRSFFSRENTVFLFRTGEVVLSSSGPSFSLKLGPGRDNIGIREFLDWYNSMELNSSQVCCVMHTFSLFRADSI